KFYAEFTFDADAPSYPLVTVEARSDSFNANYKWTFDFKEATTNKTFKVDLAKLSDELTSELVNNCKWAFTCSDSITDESYVTIKNFKIVDNVNKVTYTADDIDEVTLDGNTKKLTMNTLNKSNYTLKDSTVIYYKGFENPNIHYKVGNGDWTSAPGIEMTATNEKEGYTHKAYINLNGSDSVTACFNDGNGNWDSNFEKNYTFGAGTYTYDAYGNINKIEDAKFAANLYADEVSPISLDKKVTLKTDVIGAKGNCTYKFGYVTDDEEFVLRDYNSDSTFTYDKFVNGSYTFFVDVKDSNGDVVRAKLYDFQSRKVEGSMFDMNTRNCLIGEKVTGKATFDFEVKNGKDNEYVYTATRSQDKTSIHLPVNENGEFEFVPETWGEYEINCTVTDAAGNTASISGYVTVNDEEDSLKIFSYYSFGKDNKGVVIKNQMYTLNLNIRGGQEPYTYSYEYENVDTGSKGVLESYAEYYESAHFYPTELGKYKVTATVTDAAGATVTTTDEFVCETVMITSVEFNPEEGHVGDAIEMTTNTVNEMYYRFANSRTYTITHRESGETEEVYDNVLMHGRTAIWTPKKAGIYDIKVTVNSYGAGPAYYDTTYTVLPSGNETVIYYKGFENPNVHYCVDGGNWTNVPGYPMEATTEKEGYNYKAVINLGDANGVTVCFNDGKGNWDSANGRNYRFETGVYTYENGKLNKIK
ncbi:MAG: Ig-like domain repeat protein, partial [Lachnospiraceae bacterium]|nr:Ig-like domain repeat protein [Lachnospiraceae bacterium]